MTFLGQSRQGKAQGDPLLPRVLALSIKMTTRALAIDVSEAFPPAPPTSVPSPGKPQTPVVLALCPSSSPTGYCWAPSVSAIPALHRGLVFCVDDSMLRRAWEQSRVARDTAAPSQAGCRSSGGRSPPASGFTTTSGPRLLGPRACDDDTPTSVLLCAQAVSSPRPRLCKDNCILGQQIPLQVGKHLSVP